MVEGLVVKTVAWEKERGVEFSYDGVRLLSMLEEYKFLRQEKEEERKRQREKKKLEGMLMAEQEALFGSKPSPMKPQSAKKGARRLSLTTSTPTPTPKSDVQSVRTTPNTRPAKKMDRHKEDGFGNGNKKLEPMFRKPFSPIETKPNLICPPGK